MRSRRERSASQPERLATYLDRLSQVAGHADRIVPMQNYTKGLFLPIERKSVEPMAARLAPANVRQMHQSLHHIVAEAAWSDAALLREIRGLVEEDVPRAPVLADAAYGNDNGFRDELQQLRLEYAVGVQSSTSVWPPGLAPLPSKTRGLMGRPPKLLRRDERHQPLAVKE